MKCNLRANGFAQFLVFCLVLGGIWAFIVPLPEAHGFIPVRSSQSGAEVHWNRGSNLVFRANTVNSSGLGASDLLSIFTTSLSRWKAAARDGFDFTYYQGTDPARYPNSTGSPYDNSIFFTSNAPATDQLQCGVIALTMTWYNPGSGIANKTDLRFNDKCYKFTINRADTSTQSKIYLGDVATHELGHGLGLDHSQALQSSMIYTAAVEMSLPSCDDQAAMLHQYAPDNVKSLAGSLSGRVQAPDGTSLFGAHVQAIQLERGVVISSALSDKDGSFSVRGLEPGHYALMIEPYYPGAASLSPYHAAMNPNVCGGQKFQRTFAAQGPRLQAYQVAAGNSTNTGAIGVSCSAPSSLSGSAEASANSAPLLASGPLTAPVATQSAFSGSNDHYYLLQNQQGLISAQVLSYTLFSRADTQVELLSLSGTRLPGALGGNVFASSSGYVNYDARATATLPSPQDVIVHVYTRGQVPSSAFPSGNMGVSTTLYYALTVSRGETAVTPLFPLNARCEASDSFAAYSSAGDAPAFGRDDEDEGGSSGCGTLSGRDHDPMGPGGMKRLINFVATALALAAMRRFMRGSASHLAS